MTTPIATAPPLSATAQAFSQHLDRSPALQEQIRQFTSPMDLVQLAQAEGFDLAPPDVIAIAQTAYYTWLHQISPQFQPLFETLRTNEAVGVRHKSCHTPQDVLDLATDLGYALTLADLQTLAEAAATVPGFSCEKLWFRGLGLIS